MLNAYKNTTLHAHRVGYVLNKITKEQRPFKFRLMTDEEITETQFMRGLDSNVTRMDIATNSAIDINTKSTLIIDGYYWAVETKKNIMTKSNNGMFRNAQEKITYLALSSGGVK